MTNQQIINRFFNNPREMKTNHLRIEKRGNGFALVNYWTDLVYYDPERDHYHFNSTNYSRTTSRIQRMIRQGLPKQYATIIDGCERGFRFKL